VSERNAFRTLGELALERAKRRAVGASLPRLVDPLGQRPDLAFQRLDGLPWQRLGQGPADLGKIATQCGERVLVRLMQRRNLRVEVMELVLKPGQIRAATPGSRGCRAGRDHGVNWRGGRTAIERALARGNLGRPIGRTPNSASAPGRVRRPPAMERKPVPRADMKGGWWRRIARARFDGGKRGPR